jgi:ABC-type glutathione transport system ATPase component
MNGAATGMPAQPLLTVDGLAVSYRNRRGPKEEREIRAVDGVSFSLGTGEILALVGESGCGKTSIVKAIAAWKSPPVAGCCSGAQT